MLGELFANTNIERVLLFLFVNKTCYGSQLQTLFSTPLSPIQNALKRLENCGVIKSKFEGKKRLYYFNPDSPIRWEIENLLKKLYTSLPTQEKKLYHFFAIEQSEKKPNFKKELKRFWERLLKVETLSLSVRSRGESRFKDGRAEVTSTLSKSHTLIFRESGKWLNPPANFHNSFRWTLDLKNTLITLEHLRYGENRPTFLFHLSPVRAGKLESVDAHLCGEDTYLGSLSWSLEEMIFHWRVIGPKKNQELLYRYV
ncbi:MAG: DUF6314 family protein [Candidatus Algichlamydia australiensis]|nr:DUF6314 family protein [Chlamydiales bacterium]